MIGNRIRELRKQNKMTQLDLADRLNVEFSNVSKWELGKNNPSTELIQKIAIIFNVSIDYLLGQTDNPSPTEINYPNISAVAKRKIPYLGEIACGKPVFADEEKGVYFDVCSDLKIDFCLKAKGESKTPCLGKVNKHTGVKEYREICQAVGISKNMYCLRHTFATRCEEEYPSNKRHNGSDTQT